jgi:cell division protein FtsB
MFVPTIITLDHPRRAAYGCAAMSTRTHQLRSTNFGALPNASSDLDQLRQENERLKEENDRLKQQIERLKGLVKDPMIASTH